MRLELVTHLTQARPVPLGDAVSVSEEAQVALVLHGIMGQGGGPTVAALAERAWLEALAAGGAADPRERLARGFQAIHAALVRHHRERPEHGTIGAELAALALDGDGAWLGHVGLPRIYRLRGGALQRLTEPHATPGYPDARMHMLSSDAPSNTMPILTRTPVAPGDRFLLATGRLFQSVPESDLPAAFDDLAQVAGRAPCAAAIASVA